MTWFRNYWRSVLFSPRLPMGVRRGERDALRQRLEVLIHKPEPDADLLETAVIEFAKVATVEQLCWIAAACVDAPERPA